MLRLNPQENNFYIFNKIGVILVLCALEIARAQGPQGNLNPLPDPNLEMPAAQPPSVPAQQQPLQQGEAPTLPSAEPPNLPSAGAPPADNNNGKPTTNGQVDANGNRNLLEGIIEEFNYEVSGRRDPFLPYTSPKAISVEDEEEIVSPLQRFDLDQLTLVGIIWDTKKPKAMFLDPQSKGYIVGKLDKVGRNRGYIAEIREGEIVILERYIGEGRSTFQTRTIRLERDK